MFYRHLSYSLGIPSAIVPSAGPALTSPPVARHTTPVFKQGKVGMSQAGLEKIIDDAFEKRDGVGPATKGDIRDAVEAALGLLDRGEARVAEKQADNSWRVNQWLKKAVL